MGPHTKVGVETPWGVKQAGSCAASGALRRLTRGALDPSATLKNATAVHPRKDVHRNAMTGHLYYRLTAVFRAVASL